MKNITIALQRLELNYLIKYDTLRVSSDRIINLSFNEFKKLSENNKIFLLQNSLPIYEQDHEVILIEYNSALVSYDNALSIEFKGILSIIPLTETGGKLLSSKLDTNFNILGPLDAKIYKAFTNNRNHILRLKASLKLCMLYNVSIPSDTFIADFQKATRFQLDDKSPSNSDSTLAHLINFNTTPSFIPEGNIEALIKAACVGMKKLNKEVEQIKNSTFYSFVIEEKKMINDKSLFQAIQYIQDKIELDEEAKSRFNQLKETLSEKGKYDNAFLSFSYFYYLKKVIEKNDYDISAPKNDILELLHYAPEVASRVLFMLGYTFSIQTISKSIQSFSKCELLKIQKNLDLDWSPKEIKQEIIEEETLIESKINDESKIEKSVEFEDSVEMKQDENTLTHTWEIKDESEDKMSGENKQIEGTLIYESKINNESEKEKSIQSEKNEEELIDNQKLGDKEPKDEKASESKLILENSTIQPKKSDKVEEVSGNLFSYNTEINSKPIFTFKEFETNIKNRKSFSYKIVKVLRDSKIPESEITEQVLIECLKGIDEYKKQNGALKVAAKDALKIFKKNEGS